MKHRELRLTVCLGFPLIHKPAEAVSLDGLPSRSSPKPDSDFLPHCLEITPTRSQRRLHIRQRLGNQPFPMPRRDVDHQHHTRIQSPRIDSTLKTSVIRERRLQPTRRALARRLLRVFRTLLRIRRNGCVDQVRNRQHIQQIVVVAGCPLAASEPGLPRITARVRTFGNRTSSWLNTTSSPTTADRVHAIHPWHGTIPSPTLQH